jgi:hypothetical protein
MTEEDMADMHSLYEKADILLSSSFMIDRPAFSKEHLVASFDGVHYPHDVYDTGSQILANSLGWLLPVKEVSVPFSTPEPGKMANFYSHIF